MQLVLSSRLSNQSRRRTNSEFKTWDKFTCCPLASYSIRKLQWWRHHWQNLTEQILRHWNVMVSCKRSFILDNYSESDENYGNWKSSSLCPLKYAQPKPLGWHMGSSRWTLLSIRKLVLCFSPNYSDACLCWFNPNVSSNLENGKEANILGWKYSWNCKRSKY